MKNNEQFIELFDEILLKLITASLKNSINDDKIIYNINYIYSKLINIFSSFYITDEIIEEIKLRNDILNGYFEGEYFLHKSYKIKLQKEIIKEIKLLNLDKKIRESFIDKDILNYIKDNSTNLSIYNMDTDMINYYLAGIFSNDERFGEFVVIYFTNKTSNLKLNISKLLLEILLVDSKTMNTDFFIDYGLNSINKLPIYKFSTLEYNNKISNFNKLIETYDARLKTANIVFKEAILTDKNKIFLVSVDDREFIISPEFIIDKINKKYIYKNVKGIRDILSLEKELLLKKESFDLSELQFKLLINIIVNALK